MRLVWMCAPLVVACAPREAPAPVASSPPPVVVTYLAHPDGAWLVGRCNTVQVCLWNTKTGKARQWLQPTTKGVVSELSSVAFADNGKRIVIKTESGAMYRIDTASLH